MQSLRILFAAALLLVTFNAMAEVHKWTDANGNVHYTQQPPPKMKSETVEIDAAAVDTDVAALKLENRVAADKEAAQAQQAAVQKAERDARSERIRKSNCRIAEQNLENFNNLPRARVKGTDGEYRYLNDAQRQQQLSAMTATMKSYCSPKPKTVPKPKIAPVVTTAPAPAAIEE